MSEIRVIVVDDEILVRRALTMFLESAGIQVVGSCSDGVEALDLVGRLRPDVVLMDLQMPRMGGREATERIVESWPDTRVLAVTTFGTVASIVPVLRAGASGYILKDSDPETLATAVRTVHAGSEVLSPRAVRELVASSLLPRDGTVDLPAHERLSGREDDTIQLLAKGYSNAEIARALFVSETTAKSYLSSVMTKWGVRDRVQLLVRAAQRGIVTFDS